MAAELLSFFKPAPKLRGDWSSQEFAEFYRVEAALVQAGISVLVDRGVSDEGDPWFVFCRSIDGEVIVHFARIDGNYLIASESIGRTLRGGDFRRLLSEFVSLNPTLIPMSTARGAKLLLHPASLLAAVVATALYHMSGTEAVAGTVDPSAVDTLRSSPPVEAISDASELDRKWHDRQLAAAGVVMILLAAADFSQFRDDHSWNTFSIVPDDSPGYRSSSRTGLQVRHDEVNLENVSLLDSSNASEWFQDVSSSPLVAAVIAGTVSPPANPDQIMLAEATVGDRSFVNHDVKDTLDDAAAAASRFIESDRPVESNSEAKTVESSAREKQAQMASTPDVITLSNEFQSAESLITNELGNLNRSVVYIELPDSLSVQDVIIYAANDVLRNSSVDLYSPISISNSMMHAFESEAVTSNDTASSAPSSSSSSPYPLFGPEAAVMLNAFVRLNDVEVVTSGRNWVLISTNFGDLAGDLVQETWAMNDGSTITIIGIMPHDLEV